MKDFDYLKNINVYLFDINQYDYYAHQLEIVAMANYEGKTYVCQDIFIYPSGFCTWNGRRWILRNDDSIEYLKVKGCLEIKKEINQGK